MKIALVHGQAHKGSTYHLTRMLLDHLGCFEKDISEFNINGIGQCVGCFNCIIKDEKLCPHLPQIAPIIEAIDEADVIIFDSPNYCMGMTGQLKSFCDHMAYRWMSHRPNGNMNSKIGVAISTTAGSGASVATKAIYKQFLWWGVGKTYQIPFTVSALSWDTVTTKRKASLEKKILKISKKVKHKIGKIKPGIKTKFIFNMMRMVQNKFAWNPVDTEHWRKHGWIK